MAEYLVLIYEDEAGYATGDETVLNEVMDAHNKFGTNNAAALRGGNALQPTGRRPRSAPTPPARSR